MEPITIIDRGHGPELAHLRITVFDILPYLQAGWQPNSIAAALGLSMAEIEALLCHLQEHEQDVQAENQKIQERLARGNAPEIEAKRQAAHRKLLALRDELQRRHVPEDHQDDNGTARRS